MSSRITRRSANTSADDGVKVTVTQGIQVHYRQPYRDGRTVTVPEAVARRWIRNGWASDSGPSVLADPRGLANASGGLTNAGGEVACLGEVNQAEPQHESEASPKVTRAKVGVRARRDPRKPTGVK